ncbi:cytochrome c family protein [Novosphingobium sp. TH158]|uniref:c-type cytochrome n=1 Tax=Novosphingobium sp. TH158 TaxID=2067455 RepID=UPI000C7996F6|nr:c-type cytochrome [Novosphingobium sp. TH158]PLK27547.1 cytochrome C [Novosphingobium sp. TH158]
MRKFFAPALLLALAACGGGADKADAPAETAADTPAAPSPAETGPSLASAPAAFGQCAACHAIKPDANGVGPTLFGVVGRKAGSMTGYAYSPAMTASGLTWDEATLDAYLADPRAKVPGTKMVYAGQPDAAKRKELIDFLKTLK